MPPTKPTPAKRAATPAAAASTPGRAPTGRLQAALTPADIDRAKTDALLQLKIGREAHYYSVVVFAVLLLDALLVLALPPTLAGARSTALRSAYFLLLPALTGLFLAGLALQTKWEEYQIWPWEPHFSFSVGALAFDLGLTVATIGAIFGLGPMAHWTLWPALYPLSLFAVSLPLLGLALTWSEWSQRKTGSVVAAVLPALLGLVAFAPGLSASERIYSIALSLAAGAGLYQMSGSLLHLIASGTRAHEREVLLSGQDRLAQVADQLREREEAMRFREASLIGREADVENAEIALQRKVDSVESTRQHATNLEAEAQARANTLTRLQRDLAVKLAETNSRSRALEDQETSLGLREKDLESRLPRLATREQEAVKREAELTGREGVLQQRHQEIERKAAQAVELDSRLAARKVEIDRKTAELLEREGRLAQGEAAKGGAPGAPVLPPASDGGPAAPAPEAIESLARERNELAAKSSLLDSERAKLAEAQEAARRYSDSAQLRERRASEREAEATERGALSLANAKRYEEAIKLMEQKGGQVDTRAALLVQRSEELDRREAALDSREKASSDREAEAQRKLTEFDRRERDLLVQRKTVSSLEDELRLARQSMVKRGADLPGFSLALAAIPETPGFAGPARSRRGRTPTEPDLSPLVPPEETAAPGPLTMPPGGKFPDRLPTGTPRLDDLLRGGLPPKGHVVLIGDAFVGKEVAIYSFLAEGLKRGESAVIVTAARSPEEAGAAIGLVSPQFHEYEQLDLVRWVDASNAGGEPRTGAPPKGHLLAAGPHDHAGILSGLVKAANSFEDGSARPIRVAFLGLSACLTHGDDRQRLKFVQNVVGVLKPRNAIALYSLESGTLPETQLETVLSRLDGAIYFKRDGSRTFLSVQGIGEIQTREWIEYTATNRSLLIGSFALERIR